MQIGISIMLAYSVFSLRLSEDVPSQSDSVHLISLYLTICMFFSLSAMTWFAIVNKLREKKRLPHWLRWLILNYLSWIVCGRSMHRKASHMVKQEELKAATARSSLTGVNVSQHVTTNETPCSNNNCIDRDPHSGSGSATIPLLPSSNKSPVSNEQSVCLTLPTQCNVSSNNETISSAPNSPSLIWIRRQLSNVSLSSSKNGPSVRRINSNHNRSERSKGKKAMHQKSTKNQESLYAIHICNRFVFLLFFLTVIIINIYTWFFYSRTLKTKLHDDNVSWYCFDESRLEIVNCSRTQSS